MSCAGCDDCPSSGYHLHVTVGVMHNVMYDDGDWNIVCEQINMRPVRVQNIIDPVTSYYERIPTRHVNCTEAEAVRMLFEMGWTLRALGFQIKRLKIEQDARHVPGGRALYYEAHVKNVGDEQHARRHRGYFFLSKNDRGQSIWTVRDKMLHNVQNRALALCGDKEPKIEAAILDTNPELDKEWMQQ